MSDSAVDSHATASPDPTEVRIPARGMDRTELLELMRARRAGDASWREGKVWSLVYHLGDEHERLLEDAFGLYFSENYLNPLAFRSLKQMEGEVVRMSAHMLHGDTDVVGTMTSGGTESILLAVKTYRDRARRLRPWIRRPNLVAAESVHAAFRKACHYFDVDFVPVPVDSDYRVSAAAMARRVGRNTIMLAASAPQYPQGVIDPIVDIAALAQQKKLPFHVDACIGGFLLPWLERLGKPLPRWDFRVPGVTSISADVHKYGYSAKGASVVLYRDMNYLKHQFYIATDWSGGIYASPTMPGTRPGGCIAAAWAAMNVLGEAGYLERAQEIVQATEKLVAGIAAIDGIKVFGEPDMSLVCYGADDSGDGVDAVDIYAVADELERRGWHIDRQQKPRSIHATVMPAHGAIIDDYLADLAAAVEHVRAHPELSEQGSAALYGMMAEVPFSQITKLGVRKIMEGMYSPRGDVPDLGATGSGDQGDAVLEWMTKHGPRALALGRAARAAVGSRLRALPERARGLFAAPRGRGGRGGGR